MPVNVKEFNQKISEFADKTLPDEFKKFQRLISLAVLRGVSLKSPVLTGRLRGNWQLMVAGSTEEEIPGTTTSSKTGKQRWTSSGGNPFQNAQNSLKALIVYDTIFVFNNVPYARRIENGHSRIKAPQGMLAVTLTEVLTIFP